MTIKEMQYAVKLDLDKIDSLKTKNLLPAEIDWILNESIQEFVDNKYRDFEVVQDLVDQLSTLVVKCPTSIQPSIPATLIQSGVWEVRLSATAFPYLHLVRFNALGRKTGCGDKIIKGNQQTHDDLSKALLSPFEGPSFIWTNMPFVFGNDTSGGSSPAIYIYTNGDYDIVEAYPEYLKRPIQVFFGGYNSLDGQYTTTTPPVNCDLPIAFHRRIVDIAVANGSLYINKPDYQLRQQKALSE